jgi:hypothetical protein
MRISRVTKHVLLPEYLEYHGQSTKPGGENITAPEAAYAGGASTSLVQGIVR